jgi:hypothetical protein
MVGAGGVLPRISSRGTLASTRCHLARRPYRVSDLGLVGLAADMPFTFLDWQFGEIDSLNPATTLHLLLT